MPTAGALRRPIWIVSGLRRISRGQPGDHRRHGRGEEQRLLAGRQAGDDPLEVGQEAHVEHAVGLVEDEGVQMVEAGLVLPHVVEQPAGGGDEQLRRRRAGPSPAGPSRAPPTRRPTRSGVW